jgi:hypothetical protein
MVASIKSDASQGFKFLLLPFKIFFKLFSYLTNTVLSLPNTATTFAIAITVTIHITFAPTVTFIITV